MSPQPTPRPTPPPPPPPRPAGPAQPPRPVGPRIPLRLAVAMVATGALMLTGQWHAIPLAWLVYLHLSVRPLFSGRPAPAQHSGDVPPASARMQTALSGRPVTT